MQHSAQTNTHRAVLILPHLRVQNANAISSPLTWGFPAMTAFIGAMTALERRLGREAGLAFAGVGVICHRIEPQVTTAGYTRAFRLTRNPILEDGRSAAIVEEGRTHLDVTLVFDVRLTDAHFEPAARAELAAHVAHEVSGMRLAGGSVMPALPGAARRQREVLLELVPDDGPSDEERKTYGMWLRRLARKWLPGFALVARDDLLQARLAERHDTIDAWLDLSRLNTRAVTRSVESGADDSDQPPAADWITESRPGWIVPIPVGFAALSDLKVPGTVKNARDAAAPFRCVEPIWSIGEWIGPHRIQHLNDMLWWPQYDSQTGLYRCRNGSPNF